MSLDEINPHLALAFSESYVSPTERAWLAWSRKVERALGHSLDGDQDADGYSIDMAYEAFMTGVSVKDYLAEIKAERAIIKAERT